MGLPGQLDRVRAGDVDHRGLLDEVVGGLERRVALAEDQHALVGEAGRVHRHRRVLFGVLDAGDPGHVRLADAGRHHHDPRLPAAPVRGLDDEARAAPFFRGRPGDPLDPGVVVDPQVECGGVVGEVAPQVLRGREIPFGVAREQQPRVRREDRVPVHPEVELRILGPGVRLVDRYHRAVTRVGREERAGRLARLQQRVVVPGFLQVLGELKSGRPGSDHEVADGDDGRARCRGFGHAALRMLRVARALCRALPSMPRGSQRIVRAAEKGGPRAGGGGRQRAGSIWCTMGS